MSHDIGAVLPFFEIGQDFAPLFLHFGRGEGRGAEHRGQRIQHQRQIFDQTFCIKMGGIGTTVNPGRRANGFNPLVDLLKGQPVRPPHQARGRK
ncbi:MAG: hypothetical protein AMJ56_12645 [Anaerolineae bacterium SG8_19]|nr:MAG: hypothetical protein AMJ56_12645 [Anaerolineae bacterium SG8_19]